MTQSEQFSRNQFQINQKNFQEFQSRISSVFEKSSRNDIKFKIHRVLRVFVRIIALKEKFCKLFICLTFCSKKEMRQRSDWKRQLFDRNNDWNKCCFYCFVDSNLKLIKSFHFLSVCLDFQKRNQSFWELS